MSSLLDSQPRGYGFKGWSTDSLVFFKVDSVLLRWSNVYQELLETCGKKETDSL